MLMYFRTASKYKSPEGLFIIIGTFLLLEFNNCNWEGGVVKTEGKICGILPLSRY